MYRTTKSHNDMVITHSPPPHPAVFIIIKLHTHPPIHEELLTNVSRTAMWWCICCAFWRQPCLPLKINTATHRKNRPYASIILHWYWHTHPSTTDQKPYRYLPAPTNRHKWGRDLIRTPHDYQIGIGAIPTPSILESNIIDLDYRHRDRLLCILDWNHLIIGKDTRTQDYTHRKSSPLSRT